jgi:hypothetical protein
MIYIYRVRRFVKLVEDEMVQSTSVLDDGQGPTVHHCLIAFKELNKRYTERTARKTFAIATGKTKYLSIQNPEEHSSLRQRIVITDEGLILLTYTGFFKALANSIDASLIISLVALLVAVLVAIFKH